MNLFRKDRKKIYQDFPLSFLSNNVEKNANFEVKNLGAELKKKYAGNKNNPNRENE